MPYFPPPTGSGGGTGDVVGPSSATDAAPALFDGTTGKLIKNSTPTGTGNPVLATTPTITTAVLGSSTATTQTPGDSSTKLATTAYVDAATQGTDAKDAVSLATTANLVGIYLNGSSGVGATFTYTATGVDTIDSTALTLGMRILVKDQSSTFQNGIYTVTTAGALAVAGILTRATDFDQSADIDIGDSTFVISGTVNTNRTYVQNGTQTPTMGTDPITFALIAGPGAITSGNGITVTGLSVAIDPSVTVDKTTAQILTNKTLTDPILSQQASPSYTRGKLIYDTTTESLTFYNNDSNIALQIGQEEWIQVKNVTGSSIANGAAVYISGANSGYPTVALAKGDAAATVVCVGLATESIANNAIGYVTCVGVVHGIDTSAFSAGATVFVSASSAGALTATAPTAPNYRMRVGIVAVSDASVGSIHVTPSTAALGNGTANQIFGINNGGTAQEVKTIQGTSGNVTVTHGANTITLNLGTTPALGTPASGTMTNVTGLPISSGVSGLGSGVATFLATASSANLATAVSDETGSGSLLFGTSPTIITPNIQRWDGWESDSATWVYGSATQFAVAGDARTYLQAYQAISYNDGSVDYGNIQSTSVRLASPLTSVTTTIATSLINKTAHGLSANDPVVMTGIATTTGITNGTIYFVSATSLTANVFRVAATIGGTAITFGGTADSAITVTSATLVTLVTNNDYSIANATLTAPRYSFMPQPISFPANFNFTPTLSQGVSTNITKTIANANYSITGRVVSCAVRLSATAAGTAGSDFAISIPVPFLDPGANLQIGSGFVTNAGSNYKAVVRISTSVSTFAFLRTDDATTASALGTSPSSAIASGNLFTFYGTYTAA